MPVSSACRRLHIGLGLGFFSFFLKNSLKLHTPKIMQPRKEKLDTVLIFIGGDDRFGVADKVIEAIDQLLIGKKNLFVE